MNLKNNLLLAGMMLALCGLAHAEPLPTFSIIPKNPLPNFTYPWGIEVDYTVTNNHKTKTIEDAYVFNLPSHVSQIIDSDEGTCGKKFTLAANGGHCTLKLKVSSLVHASSDDKDNIFVCSKDSKNCSTTDPADRLNITSYRYGIPDGKLSSLSCSGPLCLTGGEYQDSLFYIQPAFILSNNSGENWFYTSWPSSIPSDLITGNINSVFCQGSFCAGVGFYKNAFNQTYQALLTTQDSGKNWAYVMPQGGSLQSTQGKLSDIDCSNQVCAAIGTAPKNATPTPSVVISQDGAHNWSYQATNLPFSLSTGELTKIKCYQNSCIAIGKYADNMGGTYAGLIYTQDAGNTWTSKAEIPLTSLDAAGALNDISCGPTGLCAAAGYSTDSISSSGFQPILFVGAAGYIVSDFNSTKPKDFRDGALNAIYCGEKACFAVGYYENNTIPQGQALAIIGNSDASIINNWGFLYSTFPANHSNQNLNSISCYQNDTVCVATGSIYDGTYDSPGIVTSLDGGQTWNIASITVSIVFDVTFGELDKVYCHQNICMAVGSYFDSHFNVHPAVVISSDGANSWSYTGIAHLPPLYSVTFEGLTCSDQNHCSAVGSYSDNLGSHHLIIVSEDGGLTWSYKTPDNL